ncbi:MAG: hypothetical protein J6X18_00995 [Bacteroidales bacterium]|nr:hypothetical protein [Bacteroidales bacterium]
MKVKIIAKYETVLEGNTIEEIKRKYAFLPFNPSLAFVGYDTVTDIESGNDISGEYQKTQC